MAATQPTSGSLQRLPVALQLYTLRDLTKDDFRSVIQAVGEIGYDGVELAGYGGLTAPDLRRLLESAGLRAVSAHVGLEALESRLDAEIAYCLELGNRWLVCPVIPQGRRQDAAGWRSVAEALNRAGERCAARGLRLGYHNHAFEFEVVPGAEAGGGANRGLDLLLGGTDPALVFWEPDVYWIAKGGADPAALIRQHAGRVPITHLKDVSRDERQTFAEVGEGTLDWPAILAAAQMAGAEWHCVEQDRCDRPPLESVRISRQHLREWGMGLR